MSSQRYQRLNGRDEDGEAPPSIALQPTAPSSPPPSFHSRPDSPSSRRLLQDDPLHRNSTEQTLADAFDDSGSEDGDEPDDRQRLMRAQPEGWADTSPPAEVLGAASSSDARNESQTQSNTQPTVGVPRRQTLLPFFSGGNARSGSARALPSSNDGVFANLAAKPERGEKTEDLPPSYEEAAADATPPYWETTIVAPGISSDEVYVDGLPVGSIFSFIWNAMISMSFQLVGFLLTYLLHTTHAAKNGSRAGLGLTLVQYGFYMKGGSESGGSDGGGSDDYVTAPDPNSHDFDPNQVVESASSGSDGGGGVSTITTSEWISYVLMIVGWFVLIRAIMDFLRARRHEQLVLQSPERGLPVPVIAENERTETIV
ncbi:hypothetical protein BJX99DRAFT_239321 [Aspergillus californicus]